MKREGKPLNDMAKNLILWVVIAIVLLSVFNNFSANTSSQTIPYSQFVEYVQSGQVDKVVIDGSTVAGRTVTNEKFETVLPAIADIDLMPMLLENNVAIEGRAPEKQSLWAQLLVACFPILLIVAIFMFFMRQMQGGGGGRGGQGGPALRGRRGGQVGLSAGLGRPRFSGPRPPRPALAWAPIL